MGTCESCGREDDNTRTVQRVYMGLEEDIPAGRADHSPAIAEGAGAAAGDIEQWCDSCCATFPHVVIRPN